MSLSELEKSIAGAGSTAGVQGEPEAERLLTPEILRLAAVVVLGAIMTILDATIVNVALPTLGRDFHTTITTIQWVPTVYLLAFAAVIPLSGWAADRFGTKRVWLASLAVFILRSIQYHSMNLNKCATLNRSATVVRRPRVDPTRITLGGTQPACTSS